MVTELKRFIVKEGCHVSEFRGNSNDEMPTGCINGSEFKVMDTGERFEFDGEHQRWIPQ